MAAWWFVALAWAAPEMIPLEVFEAARSGQPATGAIDVTLALRGGGEFRTADHRGRPVLLAFWASWCGPCRLELPALERWATAHPEVEVLTVNVDRSRPPAEKFLAAVRFDLPVAFDPDSQQLGSFGVQSMPTMFLLDRGGALVWQHTGYSQERGFTELDAAVGGLR